MIKDIMIWAVIFVIFLFTFATSFFLLLRNEDEIEGFDTFFGCFFSIFKMSVGDFETPFSSNPDINTVASILFVTYIFLVHLLYLNLLIAMMAKSYDKVVESCDGRSTLALARALVVWETILSQKERERTTRAIVPPKGRYKKMHLSNGLGFNLFNTREKRLVTLEHSEVTVVEKVDKDWR